MLRGEFRRADGLVVPNNVTSFGVMFMLGLIFDSTQNPQLYMGLGSAVYDPALTTPYVNEPDTVNGYSRVAMPRDTNHWGHPQTLNGEYFIESIPVTFSATGSGFTKLISRMFLTDGVDSTNIIALSGSLPDEIGILSTTPIEQRTFTYRLYLR